VAIRGPTSQGLPSICPALAAAGRAAHAACQHVSGSAARQPARASNVTHATGRGCPKHRS
jgi:hypothetical protein